MNFASMNQDVQTTDNVQFVNLTLSGDLTVNGETSYISSSVVQIGDNILELNGSVVQWWYLCKRFRNNK